jgi:hypothetical protein
VSLLSKPVFEMFLTLESQLVGTKPYPHDCSSKQIRHPVVQYGCHPPGAHSCRKSLKANAAQSGRHHTTVSRVKISTYGEELTPCVSQFAGGRCFREKQRPNGESKSELLFEVWERRWAGVSRYSYTPSRPPGARHKK